ncbi:hypothetical protein BCPG1_116 [Bacillus phage BCPG1]|uniref:Uncharacterized protein n=1 Tax=Bacillus phage BPS10C TaxID=1277886 RepID=W5QUK0_9CAUD|nr:hypothetical protein BPS10C_161 [Bacillus phage BPS10C]AGI12158.1 hypothetical protein BPS10C_161 [Bacillus phage BPS10C]QQO38847.1 hypothetical protein BCPG1_116 [Bacillus phage BCPG1]QSJ04672.1 hypothetical protein BCP18_140 [Bacillus phage BCP18]
MVEWLQESLDNSSEQELYDTLEEVKDDIQRAVRNSFWSSVKTLVSTAQSIEQELRWRKSCHEARGGF